MSVWKSFHRHAALMDRIADTVGVDVSEMMMRGRTQPADYRNVVFRGTGARVRRRGGTRSTPIRAAPPNTGLLPQQAVFEGLARS